jgi:hypothetical protein
VSSPNVSTVASVQAKQDAARVALLFINLGSSPCFVAPASIGANPAAGIGIKIEAQGGSATLIWEEDGEMVAWEWQAAVLVGSTVLLVMELLIDQGRQTKPAVA